MPPVECANAVIPYPTLQQPHSQLHKTFQLLSQCLRALLQDAHIPTQRLSSLSASCMLYTHIHVCTNLHLHLRSPTPTHPNHGKYNLTHVTTDSHVVIHCPRLRVVIFRSSHILGTVTHTAYNHDTTRQQQDSTSNLPSPQEHLSAHKHPAVSP